MRKEQDPFGQFPLTVKRLFDFGALLVCGEEGNPMTVGWAQMGRMWKIPCLTIMVRPTRYSFDLLEKEPHFTLNIPDESLKKQTAFCGSRSGRDTDKIRECGFILKDSSGIPVPYIENCPVHYECRIIHKNKVVPQDLDPEMDRAYYPKKDYHTLYYGEILGVYSV